ncbi:MAG: tyrosine-type recombinase/integrase [Hyphomicrobium sp.]
MLQLDLFGRPSSNHDLDPTSLQKHAEQFLEHCRNSRRLALHTTRAYASDLADFGNRIGPDASSRGVSRENLLEYARHLSEERKLKAATVRRRIATLKVFFRWLARKDEASTNPFDRADISIRLPRRLPRALETQEMRRLLKQARTEAAGRATGRQYDALLLEFVVVALFTTGLRISELTAVTILDVSVADKAIRVRGKGDRERTVYFAGAKATRILGAFLERRMRLRTPSTKLLASCSGLALTSQVVRLRLRVLAERAGLNRRVTPHMLRHTAATKLVEAGVDIRLVQRLLGHSSITTTQIYAQVSDLVLRNRMDRADTLSRLTGRHQ